MESIEAKIKKRIEYINQSCKNFLIANNPVIFVNIKKNKQVENHKNAGTILYKKKVEVYDFEKIKLFFCESWISIKPML